jgi:SHS2 domain-containing protein
MAKNWTTFEHPSDIGLSASADSMAELFEALGEGMAAQVCESGNVIAREVRTVEAVGDDREDLLVDFLSKLLHLFLMDRFLIATIAVESITDTAIAAKVAGEKYAPPRHELGAEIKAVTYHHLQVAQAAAGGWVGSVLLDI